MKEESPESKDVRRQAMQRAQVREEEENARLSSSGISGA